VDPLDAESITAITAALTAGLAAGATSTAHQAVKDAYDGLKRAVNGLFRSAKVNVIVDDEMIADPDGVAKIKEGLAQTDSAPSDLLVAVGHLHETLKTTSAGGIRAKVEKSQGTVVGHGSVVVQAFDMNRKRKGSGRRKKARS
jgi:hypothetical protein